MFRSFFRLVGNATRALELRVDGEISSRDAFGDPVRFYETMAEASRLECRMIAGPSLGNQPVGLPVPLLERPAQINSEGASGETALPIWAVPLDNTVDTAFGQVLSRVADDAFLNWEGPDQAVAQRVRELQIDRAMA